MCTMHTMHVHAEREAAESSVGWVGRPGREFPGTAAAPGAGGRAVDWWVVVVRLKSACQA